MTGDPANFDIEPAALTVKADNKARSFGAPNPTVYLSDHWVRLRPTPGHEWRDQGDANAINDGHGWLARRPRAQSTSAIGTLSASNYSFENLVNGVLTVHQYQVIGFTQPVDNLPMLNSAKAGQAIPLKFRVLDYLGNPVSEPPVTS